MPGVIYTRYLPPKKYAFFTYHRFSNFKNINFNMKALEGMPKMYFDYIVNMIKVLLIN